MNDQLIMNNYLLILKSTVEVYVHGTLESSNESIRNTLKENLNDIMTCQANTYDLMTKYGWYSVNNVNSNMISNTLSKINSKN
jgi:spore coat protein CotF